MQIVIEISKEDYDSIKYNTNKSGSDYLILNGKILPNGHGRLIDEKDLSLMTVHMIDGMLVCDAQTIIEEDGGDVE